LVGLKGIIVRETARTFILIMPDNATKIVPKESSVFQFRLPEHLKSASEEGKSASQLAVNLWGDTILYKGSERSKIKFKEKYNLALY